MPVKIDVVQEGFITTEDDFLLLQLIDWGRYTPFTHSRNAMDNIVPFLRGAHYTKIVSDMRLAPDHGGWKTWGHQGYHDHYGRLFRNWLIDTHPGSTIDFADSPDFYGTLMFSDRKKANFYGDIGHVSPLGFFNALQLIKPNDLWISVTSETQQTIIEFTQEVGVVIRQAKALAMGQVLKGK